MERKLPESSDQVAGVSLRCIIGLLATNIDEVDIAQPNISGDIWPHESWNMHMWELSGLGLISTGESMCSVQYG